MAKSKHGATRRSGKTAKASAKAAKARPAKKVAAKPARKAASRTARKPAAKAAKAKKTVKGRAAAVKKAAKAPAAKKARKAAGKKSAAKPQAQKRSAAPRAARKADKAGKASASRKTTGTRVASGQSAAPHGGQHPPHQAAPRKRVHQRPVGGVAARLSVGGGDAQTITREDGRYALPSTVNIDLPKGYRPDAKEEYMGPKQLAYFRQKLKDWRDQLVEESRQTMENLREEVRDVGDDAERATRETENSLELRTRDRYRKLISKIEKALRKIEEGRYGFCEETDEEIGLERLEARPIATLSLDAQERREHLQKQMGD
jgi:DnaK suppressor protein